MVVYAVDYILVLVLTMYELTGYVDGLYTFHTEIPGLRHPLLRITFRRMKINPWRYQIYDVLHWIGSSVINRSVPK